MGRYELTNSQCQQANRKKEYIVIKYDWQAVFLDGETVKDSNYHNSIVSVKKLTMSMKVHDHHLRYISH